MTAHDTNKSATAANPSPAATNAVTPANRDTIPVVVWRSTTDEYDATPDADVRDSPLTPRLAHHLVAIYSDIHATSSTSTPTITCVTPPRPPAAATWRSPAQPT